MSKKSKVSSEDLSSSNQRQDDNGSISERTFFKISIYIRRSPSRLPTRMMRLSDPGTPGPPESASIR